MKKLVFLFATILVLSSCSTATEEQDKKDILAIMDAQQIAWSKHDLEGFMQGYWKSDSLKFYGGNGVTLGWENTLANYKKSYPTPDHSGILKFKINDISKINEGAYFVMGAYHLTRSVGDAKGIFMIIFKKIQGEWKIIADTSS
jgi:hypothetical protein